MRPTYSLRTIMDLEPGDHACFFYETDEELWAVIEPYFRQGLDQGEKVLYIVDADTAGVPPGCLRAGGPEIETYVASGQLTILTFDDAFMRDGVFDPERLIGVLQDETERALSEGYPALRVTSEMSWSSRGLPGYERLIECESRLNAFFPGSKCLALCQYDQRHFDSEVLLNVLVTHPTAIVGMVVYDNFYYIPLTDYLGHELPAAVLRYWLGNLAGRKRAEEALARSRDFYLTLFDEFPTPIRRSGIDAKSDYFNKSWLSFTGRTFEQELGDGWTQGVHPDDLDFCLKTHLQAFEARKPFKVEYRLRHHDGDYHWIIESGRPFNELAGNFAGYIGSCYDITDRKQQEEQLAYLATHDPLTGLPNRRTLEEALKRVVARARRGLASALLFLDVDNFKIINDTLGHAAGDQALVTATRLLQGGLRAEDLIVRLGGDEFAVLLEGTTLEDARVVAERLRRAIEEHCFTLEGLNFNLSISIGLVTIDGQESAVVDLSRADAAMYRAKELGRNRVVLFQPGENGLSQISEANRLAVRLKDALQEGAFVLHYQPIVRLSDGHIECYEALVRLRGERDQLVQAGEFIGAAERFGLMPQMTRWILGEVIRTLQRYPNVRLSVNLSALDLSDEGLLEFAEARLRESGVDPGRLCFEITESAVVKDWVLAERWIQGIKSLGCTIALDDFGSGFVSFVYLHELSVDQLKLDGSFTRAVESDPAQRALVQALQTLALTQGKQLVAEFVDNEATVDILKGMGITHGQGHYLGKPLASLPDAPSIDPSED